MTKVLIVDDDDLALEALHQMLTRAGYEVVNRTNGVEALEELQAGECRLVVSDWMMPEMDGVELCRQIRKQDLPGYVYIILLTGRDRKEDIIDGLTAGADDFVTKPFEPAELLARIRIGERILSLETRDVAIFAMAKLAESRDPGAPGADALLFADHHGIPGQRRRVRRTHQRGLPKAHLLDQPTPRHWESGNPRLRAPQARPTQQPRI